jgi:hypothetical protein
MSHHIFVQGTRKKKDRTVVVFRGPVAGFIKERVLVGRRLHHPFYPIRCQFMEGLAFQR